jgi:hypothetical protein
MGKSHRKFSQGGFALFLVALLAPLVVGLARTFHPSIIQILLPLVLLLVLSAFLWFAAVRPLIAQRLWRLPRSWFEASFAIAGLYALYAAFVFITGYTPSRFDSHPIARVHGFDWLLTAAVALAIGLVAYALDKRKSRLRVHRKPSRKAV